jgi:hypothetical protein
VLRLVPGAKQQREDHLETGGREGPRRSHQPRLGRQAPSGDEHEQARPVQVRVAGQIHEGQPQFPRPVRGRTIHVGRRHEDRRGPAAAEFHQRAYRLGPERRAVDHAEPHRIAKLRNGIHQSRHGSISRLSRTRHSEIYSSQ